MRIERIKVGRLECNCYLIYKDENVLVIDPGDEFDKIIDKIGNSKVIGIVITHHHFDHDGAVMELVEKYGCMVYDKSNLSEGINKIGEFETSVIYTPGHKEDAITLYFKEDEVMFCGDFIFKGGIGRCDLAGGNIKEMKESIEKIKKYNHKITLYPGHGDKTTLGYEVNNNIYFRSDMECL